MFTKDAGLYKLHKNVFFFNQCPQAKLVVLETFWVAHVIEAKKMKKTPIFFIE